MGPGGQVNTARLAGLVTGAEAPPLPDMDAVEANRADLWATGLSPDSYPTELFRKDLDALGVVPAAGLTPLPTEHRSLSAGWSPTGNIRSQPRESFSSTWKTKLVLSMSSARCRFGSGTGRWRAPLPAFWCAANWKGTVGRSTSWPPASKHCRLWQGRPHCARGTSGEGRPTAKTAPDHRRNLRSPQAFGGDKCPRTARTQATKLAWTLLR